MTAAAFYRQRLWRAWGVVSGVMVLLALFLWGASFCPIPRLAGLYFAPGATAFFLLVVIGERLLRCPACDQALSLFPPARRCSNCQTPLHDRLGAPHALEQSEIARDTAPQLPGNEWRAPFRRRMRLVGWGWVGIYLGAAVPLLILELFGARGRMLMTPALMVYLNVWRFIPILRVTCPHCARILNAPFTSRHCDNCGFWHSGAPFTTDVHDAGVSDTSVPSS